MGRDSLKRSAEKKVPCAGLRFPRLSESPGDEKQADSAWPAVSLLLPPKPWPELPEQVRGSAGQEDRMELETE